MIYEIQIRASAPNTSSDQLIWIESSLSTRMFEQWMVKQNLFNNLATAIVVRWRIIQTKLPAHFKLAVEERALIHRIALLNAPALAIKKIPNIPKVQRNCDLNGFALAA